MAELRREIRLFLMLRAASVRGALQYRGNIAVMVLAGAAYQGSGFAFVWALLHTFGTVAGWGLGDIAFLYGMRLLAHAVWLVTLDGVTQADQLILQGQLDRVLLRPANPLLQVSATSRSLLSFGDLSVAVVVFGIGAAVADVHWSPGSVLFLILAVLGGALIEAAVTVAFAAVAVRVVNVWAVRMLAWNAIDMMGSYPLSVFGGALQRLLTYALPVAFIAFLPASLLLDRTGQLAVPAGLGFLTPVVGVVLCTVAYRYWRRQLRHYQGVGH